MRKSRSAKQGPKQHLKHFVHIRELACEAKGSHGTVEYTAKNLLDAEIDAKKADGQSDLEQRRENKEYDEDHLEH